MIQIKLYSKVCLIYIHHYGIIHKINIKSRVIIENKFKVDVI